MAAAAEEKQDTYAIILDPASSVARAADTSAGTVATALVAACAGFCDDSRSATAVASTWMLIIRVAMVERLISILTEDGLMLGSGKVPNRA